MSEKIVSEAVLKIVVTVDEKGRPSIERMWSGAGSAYALAGVLDELASRITNVTGLDPFLLGEDGLREAILQNEAEIIRSLGEAR